MGNTHMQPFMQKRTLHSCFWLSVVEKNLLVVAGVYRRVFISRAQPVILFYEQAAAKSFPSVSFRFFPRNKWLSHRNLSLGCSSRGGVHNQRGRHVPSGRPVGQTPRRPGSHDALHLRGQRPGRVELHGLLPAERYVCVCVCARERVCVFTAMTHNTPSQ